MSTKPKLSSAPPAKRAQTDDALARLEKLNDWSEEPSRAVAAALSAESATHGSHDPQPGVPEAPSAPSPEPVAEVTALAAQVVPGGVADVQAAPEAAQVPASAAVVEAVPAKPKAAAVQAKKALMPWEDEAQMGGGAVKLCNFKLPMALYLKLKWLGDTTYDSNMTKIVLGAVEREIEKLLKERGAGK